MASGDLVGRCGIYCGACPIYRATRGDEEAKRYARDVWKTPPNRMTCDGCRKLGPESHGVDCPRRICMDAKGYTYCSECPEYEAKTCAKFEDMDSFFRRSGESLRENLRRINSRETKAWLAEEEAKNRCKSCGHPVFWGEKQCPGCGKPLK